MNKQTFNNIYDTQLTQREKEIIPYLLQGLSNQEIADKIYNNPFFHPSGISHRIRTIREKLALSELKNRRKLKGKITKKELTDKLTDELEVELNKITKENLIEWFYKYRPELPIAKKLLEKKGIITPINYPEGAEDVDSHLYLQRDSAHSQSINIIKNLGCLLKIKAPKKMGKTSLINRLFDYGLKNNNHVIYFSLNSLDTNTLNNYGKFLFNFCNFIAEELSDLEGIKLDLSFWNVDNDINQQCTKFLKQVLVQLEQPLVLMLDDVERIFEYESIYQNFFPLLRNWHETGKKPKLSRIWKKLKLVIAYSTEDYGKLNPNQSPLNVGETVKLQDFSRQEVIKLAQRHGIFQETTIDSLMDLVGGHPYLIRLALYHLAAEEILTIEKIEKLIKEAVTDSGIYQKHLCRHLDCLQDKKNTALSTSFQEILNTEKPLVIKEQKLTHQLEGMGLIKIQNNTATIRYKLYQVYFQAFIN